MDWRNKSEEMEEAQGQEDDEVIGLTLEGILTILEIEEASEAELIDNHEKTGEGEKETLTGKDEFQDTKGEGDKDSLLDKDEIQETKKEELLYRNETVDRNLGDKETEKEVKLVVNGKNKETEKQEELVEQIETLGRNEEDKDSEQELKLVENCENKETEKEKELVDQNETVDENGGDNYTEEEVKLIENVKNEETGNEKELIKTGEGEKEEELIKTGEGEKEEELIKTDEGENEEELIKTGEDEKKGELIKTVEDEKEEKLIIIGEIETEKQQEFKENSEDEKKKELIQTVEDENEEALIVTGEDEKEEGEFSDSSEDEDTEREVDLIDNDENEDRSCDEKLGGKLGIFDDCSGNKVEDVEDAKENHPQTNSSLDLGAQGDGPPKTVFSICSKNDNVKEAAQPKSSTTEAALPRREERKRGYYRYFRPAVAFPGFCRKELKDVGKALRSKIPDSHSTPTETSFETMGLKPELLQGIHDIGLKTAEKWQAEVLIPMILGRDVICQAQSGMGKTAAFAIPMLQRLDLNNPKGKALILAPTRELAEQILKEVKTLGRHLGVKCVASIGNTLLETNEEDLSKPFNVVVGTVGRTSRLMRRMILIGNHIQMVIIDEADQMLTEMSFIWKLKRMFENISSTAQFVAASATMPPLAYKRCKELMRNPFEHLVVNRGLTLEGIQQYHIKVNTQHEKLELLEKLLPVIQSGRGIVFCNLRSTTEKVSTYLHDRGHNVFGLIGSMEQKDRIKTFQDFASGDVLTLIASDLIGRGLDDSSIKLVINYDIPSYNKQIYIHRTGRVGRHGRKGLAITFVCKEERTNKQYDDLKLLQEFESVYATHIPELDRPLEEVLKEVQ